MSDHQSIPINRWIKDDRPREKLLDRGSDALTTSELIAIILRSGSRSQSALSLSRQIMNDVKGDLGGLARMSVNDLMQYKGVGEAKAITLLAALELGRRRQLHISNQKDKINSSKLAYDVLAPHLRDKPHEEFCVLFLNNAQNVLAKIVMSKGGVEGTVVDARMIFKKALELLATRIICAHNHPSGNLSPSNRDVHLTKRLREAGKILQVELIDHIIIAGDSYFSFKDEGILYDD